MDACKNFSSLKEEAKEFTECKQMVVFERPLHISVNKDVFSITMQTPGQERELCRGLLFSEGIDHAFTEFKLLEHPNGTAAHITLADASQLNAERRLSSTSSCGLCGKTNINNLFMGIEPIQSDLKISQTHIEQVFDKVAEKQELFKNTGGCHAASVSTAAGELLCVFEDIGRHNAVDKAIGYLLEEEKLDEATLLTVSGRVSFEIVQKCARAKIPFLAAISAPSSLAIELSENWGITLAGFCRKNKATFYSRADRILRE